MSEKQPIIGKRDDAHHEGKWAEVKRDEESNHQLHDFYTGQDIIPRSNIFREQFSLLTSLQE